MGIGLGLVVSPKRARKKPFGPGVALDAKFPVENCCRIQLSHNYSACSYGTKIRSSSSNSTPDRVRALANMPSYKLYYFNVRASGEICRLAFSAANMEFEDYRVIIGSEEWPKLKECELNYLFYMQLQIY